MFFFNFIFWLMGLLLMGIGIYAIMDKWSSGEAFKLETIFDVIFNIGFLLLIIGFIVFIVSFAGCIGALRENMCLLRFYSLCLLIFFLAEMTVLALGFIYPNKLTEFLENELSDQLIQSYRDWSKNEYFNCTVNKEDNPSVERCGVPYSCCHSTDGALVNLMCGFNVQEEKDPTEVLQKINTRGCIPTIQALIENNLYTVGGVAIGIALSQLLVIWLARTLEGQIESQKALWTYN